MELLCDSHHGQFIPQLMARRLYDAGWSNIDIEKVIELEEGPYDNDWYWETWINILDSSIYIDKNGEKWFLYQDSDLFAATERELEDLFDY